MSNFGTCQPENGRFWQKSILMLKLWWLKLLLFYKYDCFDPWVMSLFPYVVVVVVVVVMIVIIQYYCIDLCISGDVIVLGTSNVFRFNHPREAAELRERRKVQNNKVKRVKIE